MACTVVYEAFLGIYLRPKLFFVSGAIAAHVTAPLPLTRAARSRRKSQLPCIICSGRLHSFISDTIRLEWNGRMRTASFHSNRPETRSTKVKTRRKEKRCAFASVHQTRIARHLVNALRAKGCRLVKTCSRHILPDKGRRARTRSTMPFPKSSDFFNERSWLYDTRRDASKNNPYLCLIGLKGLLNDDVGVARGPVLQEIRPGAGFQINGFVKVNVGGLS